jgi:Protein of unknown function (DUF4232)
MAHTLRRLAVVASLSAPVALAACGSGHVAAGSAPTTTAALPGTVVPTTGSSQTTTATAAATSTSGAPPACVTAQLSLGLGQANGAAGSVGYTNSFENISSTACTLFGYPGMLMLGAAGKPIPTDVIRGTSVVVPDEPERLVTLAPGSRALFQMGFSDGTGYGNDYCPTSSRVEFTPPGGYSQITVSLRINPYGGTDVEHLHCGEITVSPVYLPA